MAYNRKNSKRGFFLILLLIGLGYWYMKSYKVDPMIPKSYGSAFALERTEKNYGSEVDSLAKVYDFSSSYLKALITLECSGKKNIKPRFEQHVFEALKKVRDKEMKSYGSITRKIIHDASDEALKNLATSWGPFQLMGYQCIPLEVNVLDIRGDDSLEWGVYWINKRYGKYLKKKKFSDSFHIHNTGQPFPKDGITKTHNPKYVTQGLRYMEFFNKHY